jgi:hypothetical protein
MAWGQNNDQSLEQIGRELTALEKNLAELSVETQDAIAKARFNLERIRAAQEVPASVAALNDAYAQIRADERAQQLLIQWEQSGRTWGKISLVLVAGLLALWWSVRKER